MGIVDIIEAAEHARYSWAADAAIDKLGGAAKILDLSYVSDYQGFVDGAVLLNDGRVFCFSWTYGSCSVCDTWEAAGLSDDEIVEAILTSGVIYGRVEDFEEMKRRRTV